MFEPKEEDSFAMHFYILVEQVHQWPAIPNATVVEASNTNIHRLIFSDTGLMDVLLICTRSDAMPLTYLSKLRAMFRVVLNLHCLPNYLTDFQDIVSELCWASYHSHNFDILDARNLLNSEGEPIVAANANMIKSGWQTTRPVDTAMLFLHNFQESSEQDIENYIAQVTTALNLESVAAISFGSGRKSTSCDYSVLVK